MKGLLAQAMSGRIQAISAALLASVLSSFSQTLLPLFPLFFFFVSTGTLVISAAIVGLTTLRHGIREGGIVMLAPVLFWSLGIWFSGGDSESASLALSARFVVYTFSLLLPVWLVAAVLRETKSPPVALAVSSVWMGMLLFAFQLTDISLLDFAVNVAKASAPDAQTRVALEAAMTKTGEEATLVNGMLATVIAIMFLMRLAAASFLARWCHGLLDNPGGFGREFRELRLGSRMAWATLACAVATWVLSGWLQLAAAQAFSLLGTLFFFQGLAVAHALGHEYRSTIGAFVMLYVALVLLPPIALPLVVTLGFLDTWLDLRARLRKRS